MVECLPSLFEALDSIPSTIKKSVSTPFHLICLKVSGDCICYNVI